MVMANIKIDQMAAEIAKGLADRGIIKAQGFDPGAMTKKEIMSMLDDRGVEYSERQTKAELIALLGGD